MHFADQAPFDHQGASFKHACSHCFANMPLQQGLRQMIDQKNEKIRHLKTAYRKLEGKVRCGISGIRENSLVKWACVKDFPVT
jgi:hypothetical protein